MDKERTKENARRTPGKLRKKKDRPAGKAGRCGQSITQRIEFFYCLFMIPNQRTGRKSDRIPAGDRRDCSPWLIPRPGRETPSPSPRRRSSRRNAQKNTRGRVPLPSVSGAAAGCQQKRPWRRGTGSMVALCLFGREFVHHDSKTPSRGSQRHVKRPVNARKRTPCPPWARW